MGQILVRNLDDSVIERLKARALRSDKSLEQTVREILIEAAKPNREEALAEVNRIRDGIRARHGGDIDFDITAAIRQDRDNDEAYR
jgi:plasmid stability protein